MVSLVIIICSAVFYYRLGEHEYTSGWLLTVISLGVSFLGFFLLGWGWIANIFLQALIFVGCSVWNLLTKQHIG